MAPRKISPPVRRGTLPPPTPQAHTPWSDSDDGNEGDSPWLMSYLDFMTVLLTLFVFLYAVEKGSNALVQPVRQTAMVADLSKVATPPSTKLRTGTKRKAAPSPASITAPPPAAAPSIPTAPPADEMPPEPMAAVKVPVALPESAADAVVKAVAAVPEAWLAEPTPETPSHSAAVTQVAPAWPEGLSALAKLADRIAVKQDVNKLQIEINDSILFEAGNAELTLEGALLLDALQPVLREHHGNISVEGHSDDRPIATAHYPSNWELSTARASIVTRHLIDLGLAADRVTAVGRADTQPHADNATPEGRAQNRRVSIILQRDAG